MADFNGKVAIVTGANHMEGIGRGIALRLARDGADVVVTRSHSPEKLRETEKKKGWKGLDSVVAEIKAMGRQALGVTADISKAKDNEAMVKQVLAKFGKIDILVNNAGAVGIRGVPILEMDEKSFRYPTDVNLVGTFLCSQAVGRAMVARGEGGKIVNVVSMEAKVSLSGDRAAYIASKSALIGFTQALALEMAQYKVGVNNVCPGATPTGILEDFQAGQAKQQGVSLEDFTKDYYDHFVSILPLKRLGTPADIAGAVAFLASPDSDYMCGQTILVNGGWLMEH